MACNCILSSLVVSNCHLLIKDADGYTRHEFVLEYTRIITGENYLQLNDGVDSVSFTNSTVVLIDAGDFPTLGDLETYIRALIVACDCECQGV